MFYFVKFRRRNFTYEALWLVNRPVFANIEWSVDDVGFQEFISNVKELTFERKILKVLFRNRISTFLSFESWLFTLKIFLRTELIYINYAKNFEINFQCKRGLRTTNIRVCQLQRHATRWASSLGSCSVLYLPLTHPDNSDDGNGWVRNVLRNRMIQQQAHDWVKLVLDT